jgi:hypothetical protein
MKKPKTKCCVCAGDISKTAIGLNKKLLDRNTNKYMCVSCLADYLDVSQDELLDLVEEFKNQGCALFA